MRPCDKINVVSLYDDSEYDKKEKNGVRYRRDYIRLPEPKSNFWRVEYWASCGCCPICGTIDKDCNCSADTPEYIETDNIITVIDEFKERLVDYYGDDMYHIDIW